MVYGKSGIFDAGESPRPPSIVSRTEPRPLKYPNYCSKQQNIIFSRVLFSQHHPSPACSTPPNPSDRLIDLLGALEDYSVASTSARGEMDQGALPGSSAPLSAAARVGYTSTMPDGSSNSASASSLLGGGFPFPFPFPGSQDSSFGTGGLVPVTAFFNQLIQLSPFSQAMQLSPLLGREGAILSDGQEGEASTREALRFILSPQGAFFRDFVLDEVCGPSVHLSQLGPFSCYYQISSSTRLVPGLQWFLPRPPIMMLSHCLSPLPPPLASFLQVVKSIDALSREQLLLLVQQSGLQAVMLPVLIPGEEPVRPSVWVDLALGDPDI